MKVLLVATNRVKIPHPVYPLGLDYVAAAIADQHEVRMVDLSEEPNDDILDTELSNFHPDVVGLSLRNIDNCDATDCETYVSATARIAHRIRGQSPATLVVGGGGFSIFPRPIMKALGADYGIVGEGEWLAHLLSALEEGRDPCALPGVVCPQGIFRAPEPWQGPYRRKLGPAAVVESYVRRGGMLNVQTKRGCPYCCSYCSYPLIEGATLRRFDPLAVADEWRELRAAGARYLFVADAVFNSDPEHNLAIADALRLRNGAGPFGAFFAPVRPKPGYYEALRAAGLTHVEFGTESLSDSVLARYGKPFRADDVRLAHEAAHRAGLHVAHFLMLGGPGETLDTVRETLDRCEALPGPTPMFMFCGVRIFPRTSLYAQACAEGQVRPDDDLLQPVFYHSPDAPADKLIALVGARVSAHRNWVVGSGAAMVHRAVARMHAQGATGPLWERMPA